MRVYFISNNGVFPHQGTINNILQQMFDNGNITDPSCTYVGKNINNNPKKLIEDINNLNTEYTIVYYNNEVDDWRVISKCEVDEFIINLNINANQKLLTGEILTRVIAKHEFIKK